jgi:6,7-dimethyl-8-ribityllumazine synthase
MMRFAIIVSEFNSNITDKLLDGALSRLIQKGINANNIDIIKVPGAIEIPLIAQLLARSNKYHAIICLGAVIRGETDHYDYVCNQVSQGCQQVMLNFNIPVIFGILTTNNEEQALERVGGAEGHKGIYAADAALRMSSIIQEITTRS